MGFIPFRGMKRMPPLMVALGLVGSDVAQFECPRCGCHDRERHLFLYLTQLAFFAKFKGASILHFAPEQKLSQLIQDCSPAKYIRCDLFPSSQEIEQVNMQNIPYDAQRFDIVIANHVLEHVADDTAALKELHRVCKVGGYALLQTPFSSKLTTTFSDPGIDSDFTRLELFGQEDHVRLYGKDIFERFSSVGFEAQVVSHADVLADVDAQYFGVNLAEPLFLFKRI
jgi:SAM-dependent methyltransferase